MYVSKHNKSDQSFRTHAKWVCVGSHTAGEIFGLSTLLIKRPAARDPRRKPKTPASPPPGGTSRARFRSACSREMNDVPTRSTTSYTCRCLLTACMTTNCSPSAVVGSCSSSGDTSSAASAAVSQHLAQRRSGRQEQSQASWMQLQQDIVQPPVDGEVVATPDVTNSGFRVCRKVKCAMAGQNSDIYEVRIAGIAASVHT